MPIADYLADLFWNILEQVTHCQKFSEGADIVHALEIYAQENRLRSTTIFVTFTMDNICTAFPHQATLKALRRFLDTYAAFNDNFQDEEITIETVLRLTQLVLDNQYFVHSNGLYRQIKGGASGSSLTVPLSYIYSLCANPPFFNALVNNEQELVGR